MQSIIITSINKKDREAYSLSLCNEYNIHMHDINHIESLDEVGKEISLGIEAIKLMQETIYLAPFRGKTKAIIIEGCDRITPQAQNALLKILEEPPPHVVMILLASTKNVFLPTILSRCLIFELKYHLNISKDEEDKILETLYKIQNGSIGEKMAIAESFSKKKELTREQILSFLENILFILHRKIIQNDINMNTSIIRMIQKTHTIINTTNANPRLMLESLFISLD
ncbi:hypothetical protein LBMAG33_4250 [Candidatus Levyibacteriota bacterium]|nr:hypothetical protein LBMAG33_4250 [Candidatus Levybacteria bacterium]